MAVGGEGRLMVWLDPAETPTLRDRPGVVPMDFTGRPLKAFGGFTTKGCAWPPTRV